MGYQTKYCCSLCRTKERQTTQEDKTVGGRRGPCCLCVSVVGITQQSSYLQQLVFGGNILCPNLMEFTLLESAPFWDVCGVYVLYTQLHHMWRSSEMWQRAGRLSSATWKDICTPADVGFGELEPVSSHSLLVSVLALAYSCGCCLHPLFLLDQDETGWDSALFLLHLPCHIPTLDVGLPISITVSHPAVFFKGWRKYVSH